MNSPILTGKKNTNFDSKSSRVDCSSGVHSSEIPELCRNAEVVGVVSVAGVLAPPLADVDFCAAEEASWLFPNGFALAAIKTVTKRQPITIQIIQRLSVANFLSDF